MSYPVEGGSVEVTMLANQKVETSLMDVQKFHLLPEQLEGL